MEKIPIWKVIAERIKLDIVKEHLAPGTKLPTEAACAKRFNVNRHTVRHAISLLVEDGLVYTRRGSGAFVAMKPVRYSVNKHVRFHQSIEAMGHDANKRILSLSTRIADSEECKVLSLGKSDFVHVAEGIAYIDTTPVAHYISVFPAKRFPKMLEYLEQNSSFTKSLAACGVLDYTRAITRLTAVRANATTAALLNLKSGAALMRSINVNVDMKNIAIEYGCTWFSGDHIEFIIEP